ncbi:MAG: hypothetical protein A2Y45_02070 [Tenericutes bacterium GWC2_34_14]|nr:MAG: hypothetical protein A2Y45_02070 [Tenericutes bacterium GWC2_34_14]OHE33058.1 MAG: hypothetical protein A2012_00010 [Tenericutes bacterium GWE2_34_108]OHE36178.1 MAG: hypothetical protein A2Y46_07000 [Tenericutes bacterium GWF1_35_14]OHE38779.1 MAG: hypothetical protein A2Y44_05230 [Tenericutes bacterium GWF2_35_184]OHE44720.1 MAG: hypothetical protein A2221_00665 [Tenericutes bacterium RIFOXYA2_FULL_36_32]OHE48441.1 MAG: hypothetical protein A2308_09080 [Tenericutes bacterium RIFOXYB2
MNPLKNNYFRYGFIIMIVIIIIVVSSTATQEVNDSITIATALIGLLIIVYQLSRDHKIKKAEFIYSLNKTFNEDEDIKYIYMKLKQGRKEKVEFDEEEGRKMGSYVMFFMIMQYLLEEKLVSIKMIDSIFSNKFFLFCNNKYSFQYQLSEKEINRPMLLLYERWYNYRKKHKLRELYDTYSLSNETTLFYKNESTNTISLLK